ncbi:predicted protein [Chaetoceros tenuissimus]|uniref:Uncharacterized protein n=1 Tax=Chaetoceros tenuissimus TaxID=426638 RepID=A0AAD3D6H4_9STRA|nr:predicted protein [Chaetoceros tenuissimus]
MTSGQDFHLEKLQYRQKNFENEWTGMDAEDDEGQKLIISKRGSKYKWSEILGGKIVGFLKVTSQQPLLNTLRNL